MKLLFPSFYLISMLLISSVTILAQDRLILTQGGEVLGTFKRIKNQKVHFQKLLSGRMLKIRLDEVQTVNFDSPQSQWFSGDNPYIFAKVNFFGLGNDYYINRMEVDRKNFFNALAPYPETRGKIILGQTIRVIAYSTTGAFLFLGMVGAAFSDSFCLFCDGPADYDSFIESIAIVSGFTAAGFIITTPINFLGKKIMTKSTDNFNNSRLQHNADHIRLLLGVNSYGAGLRLRF